MLKEPIVNKLRFYSEFQICKEFYSKFLLLQIKETLRLQYKAIPSSKITIDIIHNELFTQTYARVFVRNESFTKFFQ